MDITIEDYNKLKCELVDTQINYDYLKCAYVAVSIELERVRLQLKVEQRKYVDNDSVSLDN